MFEILLMKLNFIRIAEAHRPACIAANMTMTTAHILAVVRLFTCQRASNFPRLRISFLTLFLEGVAHSFTRLRRVRPVQGEANTIVVFSSVNRVFGKFFELVFESNFPSQPAAHRSLSSDPRSVSIGSPRRKTFATTDRRNQTSNDSRQGTTSTSLPTEPSTLLRP